jgi:hypothetical protein
VKRPEHADHQHARDEDDVCGRHVRAFSAFEDRKKVEI